MIVLSFPRCGLHSSPIHTFHIRCLMRWENPGVMSFTQSHIRYLYTDEPKHYEHLSNMLLVPLHAAKNSWNHWGMGSSTKPLNGCRCWVLCRIWHQDVTAADTVSRDGPLCFFYSPASDLPSPIAVRRLPKIFTSICEWTQFARIKIRLYLQHVFLHVNHLLVMLQFIKWRRQQLNIFRRGNTYALKL